MIKIYILNPIITNFGCERFFRYIVALTGNEEDYSGDVWDNTTLKHLYHVRTCHVDINHDVLVVRDNY